MMWRAAIALVIAIAMTGAVQAEPMTLDRGKVIELARRAAPALPVAAARTAEARAGRVGAGARASTNPELKITAGPRWLSNGETWDAVAGLSWPFDLSGAPSARVHVADEQVSVAQAEEATTTLDAIGEALSRWNALRLARDRVALAHAAATLDDELVRIATVRRDAGSTGDGDVALARVLRAEGTARLRTAEAESDAALVALRAQLGLADDVDVVVPPLDDGIAPPTLVDVLRRASAHPDLVRAAAAVRYAAEGADLQRRLGKPVPRLVLDAEHAPEYAVRGGIDVPLPVYQRNQTNRAIADAHVATARADEARLQRERAADVHAQYARLLGARDAAAALTAASADVLDAERLATRAYELGQNPLGAAVAARREAAAARQAQLDARADVARRQLALELATGAVP